MGERARPLKIAIVGVGRIGRVHAAAIAASSECELAAIVEPGPGASEAAREFAVAVHADIEAMLGAVRPDAVILATPNALHVPGALACIAHGVPCLVEKPVAETMAEADTLCRAMAGSGVAVLVGHHRRHSAILEAAQAVVASGRLGRLVAVSGSAIFRKPDDYFEHGPWRRRPGGGVILINMVHEVDNLRVLAGEIVEVQAMASNATRRFQVEDTVAISLRFASGALGSFMLSDAAAGPRSWEQTSRENPAYDHHGDDDCYLLSGDRGSLAVPTLRVRTYEGEASWQAPLRTSRETVPTVDPIARQLAHFCAVVRGEAEPRVSAADAARSLAATLAIAESARTGRTIEIR